MKRNTESSQINHSSKYEQPQCSRQESDQIQKGKEMQEVNPPLPNLLLSFLPPPFLSPLVQAAMHVCQIVYRLVLSQLNQSTPLLLLLLLLLAVVNCTHFKNPMLPRPIFFLLLLLLLLYLERREKKRKEKKKGRLKTYTLTYLPTRGGWVGGWVGGWFRPGRTGPQSPPGGRARGARPPPRSGCPGTWKPGCL